MKNFVVRMMVRFLNPTWVSIQFKDGDDRPEFGIVLGGLMNGVILGYYKDHKPSVVSLDYCSLVRPVNKREYDEVIRPVSAMGTDEIPLDELDALLSFAEGLKGEMTPEEIKAFRVVSAYTADRRQVEV